MKKKKILSLMLVALTAFSLAACGSSDASSTDTGDATAADESVAAEETEDVADESAAAEDTEEAAEADQEEDISADETEANADDSAGTVADEGTGAYVDFEDMSFYVNGTKYTLGESTLQDMIDDGVPFDEDDIANAGNNLNANYQSGGFKIVLGEYWNAQVYVMNDTDSNKVTSECYINEVYLPVKTDETQDILSFAFPTNVTMEELVANAGEPDESSHYDGDNDYYSDTYEYTKESEVYYSDSKYTFEFTNGELTYITITYMP